MITGVRGQCESGLVAAARQSRRSEYRFDNRQGVSFRPIGHVNTVQPEWRDAPDSGNFAGARRPDVHGELAGGSAPFEFLELFARQVQSTTDVAWPPQPTPLNPSPDR